MIEHVSKKFIIWMCRKEAGVTRAYPDGWKDRAKTIPKWSIAFGSQTPEVHEGDVISVEEMFERLRADIAVREKAIQNSLSVEVKQHQFDALFSVYYRAGSRARKAISKLHNEGEHVWAAAHYLHFIKAGGEPNEGLARRAIEEAVMSLHGIYTGDLTRIPIYEGDPHTVERKWIDVPPFLMDA